MSARTASRRWIVCGATPRRGTGFVDRRGVDVMPDKPPPRRWPYAVVLLAAAGATFGMTALLMNINQRKQEARETHFRVVDLDENTVDPAVWGQNFPRQYDGYLRTADNERSQYGGSEALPPEKLTADP